MGKGYTELEYLGWIQGKLLLSSCYKTRPTTKTGKYAWKRCAEHEKGRKTAGGIDKLGKSLLCFGLREEWRGKLAVMQVQDAAEDEQVELLTLGRLVRLLRRPGQE